jgi:hypothetical protein
MYILERNVTFLDDQKISYDLIGDTAEVKAFKLALGGMALASIDNQDYDYAAATELVQQLFSGENISGEPVVRELRRLLDNRNNFYLDHRREAVIASAVAGRLTTSSLMEELSSLDHGYSVYEDAYCINRDGYYSVITEDGVIPRDYSIKQLPWFYDDTQIVYGLAAEIGATAYRLKANVLLNDDTETFETAAAFNGMWVGEEIYSHLELGVDEAGIYRPLVTVLSNLHPAAHNVSR